MQKEFSLSDLLTTQGQTQEHIDKIFMDMIHRRIEILEKLTKQKLVIIYNSGKMTLSDWHITTSKTPKEFFHKLHELEGIIKDAKEIDL